MDGRLVTVRATQPGATTILVVQRLAELAGPWAVAHDAERPPDLQLLPGIDFGETMAEDRAELETVVSRLVQRTLGRAPLDGEVAALLEIWVEAQDLETVPDAWATLVALLIRDPEFVLYQAPELSCPSSLAGCSCRP